MTSIEQEKLKFICPKCSAKVFDAEQCGCPCCGFNRYYEPKITIKPDPTVVPWIPAAPSNPWWPFSPAYDSNCSICGLPFLASMYHQATCQGHYTYVTDTIILSKTDSVSGTYSELHWDGKDLTSKPKC